MMIFCTLFDSNYLDKGLVLLDSLKRLDVKFKLYALAMDDKCYEVLEDVMKSNEELLPLSLKTFLEENRELAEVKTSRTWPEFCWTCTPYLIRYVMRHFNEEICTYIDSDLYFYSSPECLLDEMKDKTVQIVPHRFTNSVEDKNLKERSGTYCVQFNTFRKSPDAMALLDFWCSGCYECCSSVADPSVKRKLGDQAYLEDWGDKPCVSVLKNPGGGVAPWNVNQYTLKDKDSLILLEKETGLEFRLVFYHFHNISYIEPKKVNISVYGRNFGMDDDLISTIYVPYLKELDRKKDMLREKYGVYPLLVRHSASVLKPEPGAKLLRILRKLRGNILWRIYVRIALKLKSYCLASQRQKNIIEI